MLKRLQDIISDPKPDFNQLLKVLTRDGIPGFLPFYELYVAFEVIENIMNKKIPDSTSTVEFYYKAGYDYVPAWPRVKMVLGNLIDSSMGYPIDSSRSFDNYKWPCSADIDLYEFETIAKNLPDGMKIIGQFPGIFETAQMLLGYENLCMSIYDDPKLIENVFERLGKLYIEIYKKMASVKHVGAVVISDDLGFKTQTLLSKKDLKKYVLPWHKELCDIIHKADKPCIYHSCGNLENIMDDIIDYVGIDAKHSFENSILPVNKAFEIYSDRIAILGGLDLDFLCRNDEETVRKYVCKTISAIGENGGYALGTGNSVAAYMPIENYMVIIEEGWKLRGI